MTKLKRLHFKKKKRIDSALKITLFSFKNCIDTIKIFNLFPTEKPESFQSFAFESNLSKTNLAHMSFSVTVRISISEIPRSSVTGFSNYSD